MQGIVQSAFLWGYLGTNVLGGQLADAHGGEQIACSVGITGPSESMLKSNIQVVLLLSLGRGHRNSGLVRGKAGCAQKVIIAYFAGKIVMAYSILTFSLASMLVPLALSNTVRIF